jgi:hypothetical protein
MQVTVDSLKTAVRDAQRAATELRVELDDKRKELADAQLARAQLQGMLRDTERRLADAKEIIDLQREELTSARVERERVAQESEHLHGRLQQLQRTTFRYARKGPAFSDGLVPASVMTKDKAEILRLGAETQVEHHVPVGDPTPEMAMPSRDNGDNRSSGVEATPAHIVVVSPGETLWGLARRYKVDLAELRTVNGLLNDTILAGHTLRLPASRAARALADFAPSVSAVR